MNGKILHNLSVCGLVAACACGTAKSSTKPSITIEELKPEDAPVTEAKDSSKTQVKELDTATIKFAESSADLAEVPQEGDKIAPSMGVDATSPMPEAAEEVAEQAQPALEDEKDMEAETQTLKHRVRKGETLGEICKRYGVAVREVASSNQIRNINVIYAGTILMIRGMATVHIVKTGETLKQIASMYQVSETWLKRANDITDPNNLPVGFKLRVR